MVVQLAGGGAGTSAGAALLAGFEYALLLTMLDARAGGRWLDVGSGAHSIWPYLLAHDQAAEVLAVDLDAAFAAQSDRRRRVARAHALRPTQVQLVRADARRLPAWLDWARRPWDTAISGLLLRPVADQRAADAVLLVLRKPTDAADATGDTERKPRSA